MATCVHQKEMMMQSGLDDVTKQRMLQAKALCKEARGVKCGLGKMH